MGNPERKTEQNPLDIANGYETRINEIIGTGDMGRSKAIHVLAKELSISTRRIFLYLSLLKLEPSLQELVVSGNLAIRYAPIFVKILEQHGMELGPELAVLIKERLPGGKAKTSREIIDGIIVDVLKNKNIPDPHKKAVLELRNALADILEGTITIDPNIKKLLEATPGMVMEAVKKSGTDVEKLLVLFREHVAGLLTLGFNIRQNGRKKPKR